MNTTLLHSGSAAGFIRQPVSQSLGVLHGGPGLPWEGSSVQLPTAPLVGAAEASHGLSVQVAAVSVPVVQVDVPETV